MTHSSLSHHPDPSVDAAVHRALGQLDRLEAAIRDGAEEALDQSPPDCDDREDTHAMVVRLCKTGEFRHALPLALALVAHHGEDARFAFLAGSCLQRLDQHDLAVPMFLLTLARDGTHAAAAYRLGEVLLAQGHKQEARRAFDLALELGRDCETARGIQDMAMERMKSI